MIFQLPKAELRHEIIYVCCRCGFWRTLQRRSPTQRSSLLHAYVFPPNNDMELTIVSSSAMLCSVIAISLEKYSTRPWIGTKPVWAHTTPPMPQNSAWCMALPENTEDVQVIARVLTEHQCPFGIKAGGHSAWKGSSGIQDGVTIDFGKSCACTTRERTYTHIIRLHEFHDVTTKRLELYLFNPVRDGGTVYEALDKYNLTVVGARTSVVGVGGFTTGGGVSFPFAIFSPGK